MKLINIVVIFFCFLGCTGVGPEDVKTLCDGTDDLVIAIRADGFHRLADDRAYFSENGLRFIYVNGRCEFWSYGKFPHNISNNRGMRVDIQTGTLTEDQGIELLERLNWNDWEELDDTYYFDTGGSAKHSFFSKTSMFGISRERAENNDELRLNLIDGSSDAVEYLNDLGKPISEGNLRVYVASALDDNWWDSPFHENMFFEWPLEKSLISELSEKQAPYCFGTSFLVTGTNADKLREQRAKYRKKASKTFTRPGIVDGDGRKHLFYIRDVLPMENAIGLVPLNDAFSEIRCFR